MSQDDGWRIDGPGKNNNITITCNMDQDSSNEAANAFTNEPKEDSVIDTRHPPSTVQDRSDQNHLQVPQEVETYEDEEVFRASFSEQGGRLQRRGSEVVLFVPKGAVPKGKTYTIEGRIETNLSEFNHLMKSPDEFIIGPIPDYRVVGGGTFEKPVQIEIPVCVPTENGIMNARVLEVEETDTSCKEINPENDVEKEGAVFTMKDNKILISTTHFTKFICTYHGQEEVTDAILVVYASTKVGRVKTIVKLRVMIHFKCAGQNDFSSQRDDFLDPDMEEVVRQKIVLPIGKIQFPEIVTKHIIHESETSEWRMRTEGGVVLTPMEKRIDGKCLCFNGPNHRSEHLAEFCLENSDITDPPMLHCHVTVKLNDTTGDGVKNLLEENLIVDFKPDSLGQGQGGRGTPRLRHHSGAAKKLDDIDDALITNIAKTLGVAEYMKLGIILGLELKDLEQIKRSEEDSFLRVFRMLDQWKKKKGDGARREDLECALKQAGRMDIVHDFLER